MKVAISGMGAWGPGFSSVKDYYALQQSAASNSMEVQPPKPERIPSRERRRSPLMVKLAVEVADQACQQASIEPADAQSVFMSGVGDADITDYMCRVLSGPEKLLSPTKFHNSVHNAAAGIWSISTHCEKPATFVASMRNSFVTALLESMVQVQTEGLPVLLVMTDIAMPTPFLPMHPIEHMVGVALVLKPFATTTGTATGAALGTLALSTAATNAQTPATWPSISTPSLNSLYKVSPTARSFCLLDALSPSNAAPAPHELRLPLSKGVACELSVQNTSNQTGVV